MKHWTSEELTLQEEKEANIQEYYNSIGLELKDNTSLITDTTVKSIYKKLVELLPNLIASDEYILAILASNIGDFKFFNKQLEKYRKEGNIEAYMAIQKAKNSTSNSILTQLKSLGLTPDTRHKITFIFENNIEEEEEY